MAIIRPSFMPKAPGWIRWPAYIATFGVYCTGLGEITREITSAFGSPSAEALLTLRSLVGLWAGWAWFNWPTQTNSTQLKTDVQAPVLPERRRGDLGRLILTASAIVLGLLAVSQIVTLTTGTGN